MIHEQDIPLLCHRCGMELVPGEGNFYVVRIEGFADPTPPTITSDQLDAIDFDDEFERLLEQMREMSEQELMDQVYRRLIIHLCVNCYGEWFDNPTA